MTDCYGQALRESVEVAWVCVGGGSQRLWYMQVQIAVRSGLWVWGLCTSGRRIFGRWFVMSSSWRWQGVARRWGRGWFVRVGTCELRLGACCGIVVDVAPLHRGGSVASLDPCRRNGQMDHIWSSLSLARRVPRTFSLFTVLDVTILLPCVMNFLLSAA